MTKIDLGRIFETSKLLQTKAGRETQDGWNFLSDFAERSIRALRNGLSFADNSDCVVSDVELPHNEDQIVDTGGKIPVHIVPTRVITSDSTVTVDSFGWRIDSNSETTVLCNYGNTSETQTVRLVIFFS